MLPVIAVETSQTLLDSVAKGDDAAWTRFVLRYQPLLFGRCRGLGLSIDDSNCLVQDIFIELFRRIQRFSRRRTGSFRKWLSIIVRSRILDKKRSERIKFEHSLTPDMAMSLIPANDGSENPEPSKVHVNNLLDAIRSRFTDRDWTIFYLTVGEERAPSDVAATLGVSENTVYLTKSRMIKKIRNLYSVP